MPVFYVHTLTRNTHTYTDKGTRHRRAEGEVGNDGGVPPAASWHLYRMWVSIKKNVVERQLVWRATKSGFWSCATIQIKIIGLGHPLAFARHFCVLCCNTVFNKLVTIDSRAIINNCPQFGLVFFFFIIVARV